jgi:hypothetical protein
MEDFFLSDVFGSVEIEADDVWREVEDAHIIIAHVLRVKIIQYGA